MSLREIASRDLLAITTDEVGGFGWPITLIDPAGIESPAVGFSNDIGQAIEPETGMVISGRTASVAIHVDELPVGTRPRGIKQQGETPWRVRFADIEGKEITFKVTASDPDASIGLYVLHLGAYSDD